MVNVPRQAGIGIVFAALIAFWLFQDRSPQAAKPTSGNTIVAFGDSLTAGLGLLAPPTTVARPNLLCDPNEGAPHTAQQWFNTACFERNPAASAVVRTIPGNAARGIINGPPTTRFDFTMSKRIWFRENLGLQLRAEIFNIFNHTNFRGLSTNVTAATFGQSISTRDPRTMQFGAKLSF